MLALIGSGLVLPAFRPGLRAAAVPGAALSMATYALSALAADVNDRLHRVEVLLGLLAAAVGIPERGSRRPDQ